MNIFSSIAAFFADAFRPRKTYLEETGLLPADEKFYIRPEQIPYGPNFLSSFGKAQSERAAWLLVLFFKTQGCWRSATLYEVNEFIEERDRNDQSLCKTVPPPDHRPWLLEFYRDSDLIRVENGMLSVSTEFVERCAGIERNQRRKEILCKVSIFDVAFPERLERMRTGDFYKYRAKQEAHDYNGLGIKL